jgi:integral membrane protein
MPWLTTALGRFRIVALLEGLSYLGLFFVTMPLKYLAEIPGPNKVVGMTHGVLSVVFVIVLISAAVERGWSMQRVAAAVLASLLPFGTFVFEWDLRKRGMDELTPTSE